MNAFVLKIIACITMFIDHLGYLIFDGKASWLNYVGRLAFPIFAFQISEGYIHTKDVKKYLFRLIVFAFISQIPFSLFYSIISDKFCLNVIFTLFLGLVSIVVYDKFNKYIGLIVAIILAIMSEVLKCDYGFYGVFVIFLFYVFHKNKYLSVLSFCSVTILNYTYNILKFWNYGIDTVKTAFIYYIPYAICTISSVIFIILYNKKKGANTRYLLYLFYPLHLLFIYALSIIV